MTYYVVLERKKCTNGMPYKLHYPYRHLRFALECRDGLIGACGSEYRPTILDDAGWLDACNKGKFEQADVYFS